MPMQKHGLDSRRRRRTKKITGVDLTVAGVAALASTILFQPPYGTRWLLQNVILENKGVTGTVTDAPRISVDNGVDSGTIVLVAAVDLSTTDGVVKIATLALPLTVLDSAHPIRLNMLDGADGSTAFPVNVTLELLELSS